MISEKEIRFTSQLSYVCEYCPVVFDKQNFCMANFGIYSVPLDFPFRFAQTSVSGEDINETINRTFTLSKENYMKYAMTLEKVSNKLS